MTEPAEPTVRLTWRVEEDHAKTFTAVEWARFVGQLDPDGEHNLPTDLSQDSIDRVNSYLTDQSWYTNDVLGNLASGFTWRGGEIALDDIVLRPGCSRPAGVGCTAEWRRIVPDDDYVALRAELERDGYREIPEAGGIKAGDRVHSYGEQYPEARRDGTATVLAVMRSGRVIRGRPDVEIIVERDEPLLPDMSCVTNWADYGTCTISR